MAVGDIDDEGSVRSGERAAQQREAGRLVFGDDWTDVEGATSFYLDGKTVSVQVPQFLP